MLIAELFKALSNEAVTRPYQTAVTSVLVSFLAYIIVNEYVARSARLAAFDGPKRLPIVGNLHQLRSNAAEKYREWAKTYGPVYQIQLGNIPILLVNSASAARTVFGTNSSATASRPEFYTFHKVLYCSVTGYYMVFSTNRNLMLARFQHRRYHDWYSSIQRIS